MIEKIHIQNYKSIEDLEIPLGRVTVLIGENGSGKSNILEAVTMASAASQDKLDNEFLASRGIRVALPELMRSGFEKEVTLNSININIHGNKNYYGYILDNNNKPYSKWRVQVVFDDVSDQSFDHLVNDMAQSLRKEQLGVDADLMEKFRKMGLDVFNKSFEKLFEILHTKMVRDLNYADFLIYSPELSALRTFEKEGQIEPLGINGEGLFKLLKVTKLTDSEKFEKIKEQLRLIGWFSDFDIPNQDDYNEFNIHIRDRFLDQELPHLTQKNVNEGFLFLLFYITLFISDKTPAFFAIDNIEASLNPKLCIELMSRVIELAKEYNKQVILTTHNPAILDAINVDSEEQKVLVVSRNKAGRTKVKPLKKPRLTRENEKSVKLSEAFMNGMIGGLPKGF